MNWRLIPVLTAAVWALHLATSAWDCLCGPYIAGYALAGFVLAVAVGAGLRGTIADAAKQQEPNTETWRNRELKHGVIWHIFLAIVGAIVPLVYLVGVDRSKAMCHAVLNLKVAASATRTAVHARAEAAKHPMSPELKVTGEQLLETAISTCQAVNSVVEMPSYDAPIVSGVLTPKGCYVGFICQEFMAHIRASACAVNSMSKDRDVGSDARMMALRADAAAACDCAKNYMNTCPGRPPQQFWDCDNLSTNEGSQRD